MAECTGREHLVLDLSCRQRETDGSYVIVTDRWQKFTDVILSRETILQLASSCDEFLVHAADVEGLQRGPRREVLEILAEAAAQLPGKNRITYAGGIRSFGDLDMIRELGKGMLDFTIGSALDLFGGSMPYEKVCALDS